MRQAKVPKIAPAGGGDTELVRRALGRDEAAVRAIITANNRRLYRLARGILRMTARPRTSCRKPTSGRLRI
jgi:RNA polymerase sigma-70 factor (ECF subfamily)